MFDVWFVFGVDWFVVVVLVGGWFDVGGIIVFVFDGSLKVVCCVIVIGWCNFD